MSALNQIKNTLHKFHNDERGLEALQTVMILAAAAVALIAVKSQWVNVKKFFVDNMGQATSGWDGAATAEDAAAAGS
jgi:Flp pilus assembly pilin Flp